SFAGFGVEVKGEGCYLFDEEGAKYLDCLGGYGVFSLGHRHPKVVEAVSTQLADLPLSGKVFFSEKTALLAHKLAEISPEGLEFAFFSNSGAEAVEAAIKFAKGVTERPKIIAFTGGYHGKTLGALSATSREKFRQGFQPLMPGPVFVPYGNAEAAAKEIDGETACVLVETIQGEGGINVPPAGFMTRLRELCDAHGALLVADEVQTGLGRTGEMFGCDHERVSPDLMPLAKALGGGVMPIGATLGTANVWEKMFSENPLRHTSTFGGNPLACAAALATIETIQQDGLAERAKQMGAKLKAGLEAASDKAPGMIKEVRGEGLMLGVEFALDEVGELVIAQMTMRGLVAAYTLNNPRVIRFEPPLIVSDEQIEFATKTFGEAIAATHGILAEAGVLA
ncbi:MAG: aspartate aminotransferase family protein, partial [Fimbriimonadaceae bacterium]